MFDDFRLRIFETVAAERSFTRAAKLLGISQSAVSQSIAELERQFGVQLFLRSRSSVDLTAAGRSFSGYARHILYWYKAADNAFSIPGASSKEEILISAAPDLASSVVPEMIQPFLSGESAYRFKVISDDVPENVCDLRMSCHLMDDGEIAGAEGECAGISPVCAVTVPSDRNAYKGVSSISDIEPACFALWTGWSQPDPLLKEKQEASLVGLAGLPGVMFRSDSAEAVIAATVSSGQMAGLVPLYAAYKKLADRTIVRLPLIKAPASVAIYMEPSVRLSSLPLYKVLKQRLSDFLVFISAF